MFRSQRHSDRSRQVSSIHHEPSFAQASSCPFAFASSSLSSSTFPCSANEMTAAAYCNEPLLQRLGAFFRHRRTMLCIAVFPNIQLMLSIFALLDHILAFIPRQSRRINEVAQCWAYVGSTVKPCV
jgi:hypothetical protein